MSLSGFPSVSSMVLVQDFALLGLAGQTGRRAQQKLITVGFIRDSFCHPIGKRSKPVISLIICVISTFTFSK